jgi:hypothetical protein
MHHVLQLIDKKTREFAEEPLYAFMRDTRIDPRRRLAFVPALAHFVMTFADLYGLILREEPARDRYQEIVNAHTYEDGGHWKWFLADLEKLGEDPRISFSDALRFVWGEDTARTRLLSYHMCRLAIGADSLHKLVLVQCIEATGSVSLRHAAAVAAELAERTGKKLVYFGAHHFDTEGEHTLEQDDVRASLAAVELGADVERDLSVLVERSFALFADFAADLLAIAQGDRRLSQR